MPFVQKTIGNVSEKLGDIKSKISQNIEDFS